MVANVLNGGDDPDALQTPEPSSMGDWSSGQKKGVEESCGR